MPIDTGFSMVTLLDQFKKIGDRVVDYVLARLAFTVTALNLLIQWHGLNPDPDGFIPLGSVPQFP